MSYDTERSAKTLKITTPSGSATGTANARLKLYMAYADLVYYSDKFYFKVGPNIAYPDLEIDTTSSYSTYTDYGLQFGVGFAVDEHLILETVYRKIHFKTTMENGDSKVDFKTLRMDGLQLGIKYRF